MNLIIGITWQHVDGSNDRLFVFVHDSWLGLVNGLRENSGNSMGVVHNLLRFMVFLDNDFFSIFGTFQQVLIFQIFIFQILNSLIHNLKFLLIIIIIWGIDSCSVFDIAVLANLNTLFVNDSLLIGDMTIQLGDFILILGD